MQRHGAAMVLGLLLAAVGGGCCSSHPLMDAYGDVIDWIGEQEPELDFLYHPALDINRAGDPEWCRSRFNRCMYRLFCRRACHCSVPQPPSVYFYPSPDYGPSPHPVDPRAYYAGPAR